MFVEKCTFSRFYVSGRPHINYAGSCNSPIYSNMCGNIDSPLLQTASQNPALLLEVEVRLKALKQLVSGLVGSHS